MIDNGMTRSQICDELQKDLDQENEL
jgi:hypothetical protein